MPDHLTEQWNQDDLQFKAISGQFNVDEAEGIVECFVAAVGNKDSVGDIVAHGAFDGSLRRRKPRVVWGHDWNQPIGKVLAIDEVAPNDPRLPVKMRSAGVGGLLARVQFNLKSERGREAFASVAFFGEDQEWCVDAETEMLTGRGWLRYDEIATDDTAYVIDPELGYGRFEPIEAINVFPAKSRSLRRIETGGHSSLTTAAHRWPVRSNANGGNLGWTTTKDLRSQDAFIRAAPRADAPEVGKYSDAFVEFVGWFWTEGWRPPAHHSDAALYIAQSTSKNPQHVASIRAAVQSAFPGQWSESHSKTDMARFRVTRSAAECVEAVVGADKEPTPEFLLNLTRAQLHLLINTCMSGDGHATPSGQRTWYQCAESGVRAFEMLCALAGQPTNTKPQKDYGNRYGAPPQRVALLNTGVARPLDAIRVKGYGYKEGPSKTPAIDEWVNHEGIVWCPTTPSHTWLARRHGSVYFTGNSIGYKTIKASYDPAAQANVLQEVELFEVSPVLHGANQLTGTISVKSADYEDTVAAYGGDASEMNESNRNPGSPVKDAESAPMKRRIRLTMGDDGYGRFMDGAKIHAMEVDRLRQSLGNSGPTASDLSGEGDHPGLGASLSRALGSQVNLRLAGPNFVVFDRQESDGDMDTYFLAYHEEQGRFMFGEPMEIEVETVIRLVPEGHGEKSIESFTKGATGAGRWLRASEANMRIVNAELALTQGRKDV